MFPLPKTAIKLWFQYIVRSDRDTPLKRPAGYASDYSNVKYDNMLYGDINDVGKQWIRRYTLALSKDLLGAVRSKYASIPSADTELSLDGTDLRAAAQSEIEALITELRENLEATSKQKQLEKEREEAENIMESLKHHPLRIYVG